MTDVHQEDPHARDTLAPDTECYILPNGNCIGAYMVHNGYIRGMGKFTFSFASNYLHPLLFSHVDPNKTITPPTRAHASDCGYDLYVSEECSISPMGQALIDHNLKVQLPPNTWGLVIGRSSNWKRMLEVGLGVIDNSYRGPLFARVVNLSGEEQKIEKGHRVAQLILIPMNVPPALYISELSDSDRGESGFGSTGQ